MKENKHEAYELAQMQSLPLEAKIRMTKMRIRDWYDYWDGNVYVSVSGGKDSQVLAHIVKEMYDDVPLVFVNTGLEFDSVRLKGMELEDEVLRPEMSFVEVIKKYGYPIISKEVSQAVDEGKRYMKALTDRQTDASVCLSHSRLLWCGQTNRQRQRIIQAIEDGEYP